MPRPARIEEIIDGTRKLRPPKEGRSLAERFPEVARQWCQERNGDITPADISGVAGVVVWWHCDVCGGDYDMSVAQKTASHSGCPFCRGPRVLPSFNSLQDRAPELAAELSPKNPFTALEITAGTGRMAIWQCSQCGTEWQAPVEHRLKGGNHCPKCSHRVHIPEECKNLSGRRRKIMRKTPEERQLRNHNPELLAEWDYEANEARGITPEVSYGTNVKAMWICPKGHHYEATINHRAVKHTGCPYCAGRKVMPNSTDLATTHPDIAKELNVEASGFDATTVSAGNATADAVWNCPVCGNIYPMRVWERTHGSGCPKCARKVSDLAARMPRKGKTFAEGASPTLLAEWSPKNDRTPDEVALHSTYRALWVCSNCHHEWEATVTNRAGGSGCPRCSGWKTSFAEQAIHYYLMRALPDEEVVNGYVIPTDGDYIAPVDVAIVGRKIAIEHDGAFWHAKRQKRDDHKQKQVESEGWRLIRIKEFRGDCPAGDIEDVIYYESFKTWGAEKHEALSEAIRRLLALLDITYDDVNTQRDREKIYAFYKVDLQERSAAAKCPELIEEWSPRNLPATLDMFTPGSNFRAWWVCSNPDCQHEWQTAINNRTGNGTGCPICAHRRNAKTGRFLKKK